jgi:hypothetical protein
MAHRIVILEQLPSKDVWLCNHVEDDWLMATSFRDAMLDVIRKRGNVILYTAIFNLDEKKPGG